jgi:hypothetical protein
MGTIRHNAIVITASAQRDLVSLQQKCTELGVLHCTQPNEGINGYRSLLVCPDGSKEGWPASDEGNNRRDLLAAWLKLQGTYEWAEVWYGEHGSGDLGAGVVRNQWSTEDLGCA